MKPTRPIFVASKGRPDAPTFKVLRASGLNFTAIVEPQDADAYEAAGEPGRPALAVMEENDRGLAYVRQFALDNARDTGCGWYWMLDDDISGFYRTNPAKTKNEPRTAAEALGEAEAWAAAAAETGLDALGIVALEYQQFAWNAHPGRPTWGSYTDVATIINPDVPADYRLELPLKVDRDFTLSVISMGYLTARLRWLSFAVPTNGTNQGGQHDVYDSLHDGMRKEEWSARRLAELWPGIVEFQTKPNGRPDAKVHWQRMQRGATTL